MQLYSIKLDPLMSMRLLIVAFLFMLSIVLSLIRQVPEKIGCNCLIKDSFKKVKILIVLKLNNNLTQNNQVINMIRI